MQASMKESQKLLIREKKLKKEIAYFFQKLMQRILYKLEKDWDSGILNINDYTEIVDIAHKDYFDILYTHVQREYYRARKIGENKVNRAIVKMATKADTPQINISRTDLWGTMSEVEEDLENMTFQASDKTLERVKEEKITQILHQGYADGRNGTEVGREIKREFSKLKTYEAERIARTELHSAHEKGLIDQYKEMDVQYKQWDAHIDNRTRSSHIDLNGEITTIDGTFSNGLTRPGDKNGPIKEWIHCRCTLSPFLMPIDKMPPYGTTNFKESDLISNRNEFNYDDYNLSDAIIGNWHKEGGANWDLNRLTPYEREFYKDIIEYGEFDSWNDELIKFERKIKDKNIIATNNQKLPHSAYNGDEFDDEMFTTYYLQDQDVTIWYSEDDSIVDIYDFIDEYEKLHKALKRNIDEIVLTSSKSDDGTLGFCMEGRNVNRLFIYNDYDSMDQMKYTLIHEAAHLLEIDVDYFISTSDEYIKAFYADMKELKKAGLSERNCFVTGYAWEFYTDSYKYYPLIRRYSEDFAESVTAFFMNSKEFKKAFPKKYEFIKQLFSNSSDMMGLKKRINSLFKDKYALSSAQSNRRTFLKTKQLFGPLSYSERKELSLLEAQYEFNILHNKRLSELSLNREDRLRYVRLLKWLNKESNLDLNIGWDSTLFLKG